MNLATSVVAALLLASLPVAAQTSGDAQGYQIYTFTRKMFDGHEEWLKCQRDDQCIRLSTPMCSLAYAVNKDFLDPASRFASNVHHNCTVMADFPDNTTANCINNECVVAIPK